jgi:NUMOD4 motif/HNH endonuclease
MENWITIEDYMDYQVSNTGKIRSFKKHLAGIIIKPQNNGNGYLKVTLCDNGKLKQFYVHRLVGNYFVDNPDNYKEINHKDGNKENNSYKNLEWCDDYRQRKRRLKGKRR